MSGTSLCLWDTKKLFPLGRWGQCWWNDLPKSSGVSGRTVLWASLMIGLSPWHQYWVNTALSISYELCHPNSPDFMELGSFIFFQLYNNVLWRVCDGCRHHFCAHSCILEASKEGLDLFAPKPQKLNQLPQKVCKQIEILLIPPLCLCSSWPGSILVLWIYSRFLIHLL